MSSERTWSPSRPSRILSQGMIPPQRCSLIVCPSPPPCPPPSCPKKRPRCGHDPRSGPCQDFCTNPMPIYLACSDDFDEDYSSSTVTYLYECNNFNPCPNYRFNEVSDSRDQGTTMGSIPHPTHLKKGHHKNSYQNQIKNAVKRPPPPLPNGGRPVQPLPVSNGHPIEAQVDPPVTSLFPHELEKGQVLYNDQNVMTVAEKIDQVTSLTSFVVHQLNSMTTQTVQNGSSQTVMQTVSHESQSLEDKIVIHSTNFPDKLTQSNFVQTDTLLHPTPQGQSHQGQDHQGQGHQGQITRETETELLQDYLNEFYEPPQTIPQMSHVTDQQQWAQNDGHFLNQDPNWPQVENGSNFSNRNQKWPSVENLGHFSNQNPNWPNDENRGHLNHDQEWTIEQDSNPIAIQHPKMISDRQRPNPAESRGFFCQGIQGYQERQPPNYSPEIDINLPFSITKLRNSISRGRGQILSIDRTRKFESKKSSVSTISHRQPQPQGTVEPRPRCISKKTYQREPPDMVNCCNEAGGTQKLLLNAQKVNAQKVMLDAARKLLCARQGQSSKLSDCSNLNTEPTGGMPPQKCAPQPLPQASYGPFQLFCVPKRPLHNPAYQMQMPYQIPSQCCPPNQGYPPINLMGGLNYNYGGQYPNYGQPSGSHLMQSQLTNYNSNVCNFAQNGGSVNYPFNQVNYNGQQQQTNSVNFNQNIPACPPLPPTQNELK